MDQFHPISEFDLLLSFKALQFYLNFNFWRISDWTVVSCIEDSQFLEKIFFPWKEKHQYFQHTKSFDKPEDFQIFLRVSPDFDFGNLETI